MIESVKNELLLYGIAPNIEPIHILREIKELILTDDGNLEELIYIAGRVIMDSAYELKEHQSEFVDFFMLHAEKYSSSPDYDYSALFYGLSVYDLGKYISFIVKVMTEHTWFDVYNIRWALLNVNYKNISKKELMKCLFIMRSYRRMGGANYLEDPYNFNMAIEIISQGILCKNIHGYVFAY